MEDIIDIIVTETTNTIEITSQSTDEVIDVNIIDNREDITLNVTPTVVEININSLTGNFGINWGEITGTLSNQTDLNTALGLKADLVGGKVPSSQLPSYVDDVVEVANYAALPATGETGKIYVTIDTNYIYRWTGSVYVEIKDSSAVWGAITGTLSNQTDLQNALNAKDAVLTFSSPLSRSTNTVSIPAATTSVNGYLTSTDWTTFNSKQAALSGTGFVKSTAGTISYDTNTYALDSAVVHNTGNESVAGLKTFTSGISADYLWIKEGTGLANPSGYAQLATDLTYFHFNNSNNTAFARFLYGSGQRTYTLPNSNGTIALTSDLHNAVTIGTANGLSLSTQVLSLGLASSTANGALSSTDWSTFNGKQNALSGTGFVKISGSTISYDNSTYLTTSSAASTYLPLSGGTLTGALNGTSGTFTGNVSTSAQLRIESSGNALLLIGSRTSGTVFEVYNSSNILRFYNGTVDALQIATGSGAATFSSSVTAAAFTPSYSTSYFGTDGTISNYSAANYMYVNGTGGLRLKAEGVGYQKIVLEGGTSNDVWFTTANTERLRITSGGNVGIGTTSPTNLLTIANNSAGTNGIDFQNYASAQVLGKIYYEQTNDTFRFVNRSTYSTGGIVFITGGDTTERMRITSGGIVAVGTSVDLGLTGESLLVAGSGVNTIVNRRLGNSNTTASRMLFQGYNASGTLNNTAIIEAGLENSSSNGYLAFSSNTTERMRITSGGNVLIGTSTDAGYKLDVQGKGAIRSGYAIYGGTTYTSYTSNGLWGATATPNIAGTNGQGGTYSKYSGINGGLILGYQDNGNGLYSPAYGFEVKSVDGRPVGGIVVKAIVMKDVDTNAEPFYVYNNGAVYALSYNSSSDYRLKQDLKSFNGLEIVSKINTYDYEWKSNKTRSYGVLAHELSEILPYAVMGVKDGNDMQGVDYSKIVPVLIQSIKELKAELDTLKNK